MAGLSGLAATFPLHSELNAYVSNVHNVPQLGFFIIVKNAKNIEHFAKLHGATTPEVAFKCTRMPPEGYVFALRMGESTMLRAIRLPTMCITKTREVFLPDVGRNYIIPDHEVDMYHLPFELRKPPGIAISCQLKGINDDVTILTGNMRAIIRGLLYRSVQLRVDGYIGGSLRVQLMNVTLNQLVEWNKELGEEESNFEYALNHIRLDGSKFDDDEENENTNDKEETFNEKVVDEIDERNEIASSNGTIDMDINGEQSIFINHNDSNNEKDNAFSEADGMGGKNTEIVDLLFLPDVEKDMNDEKEKTLIENVSPSSSIWASSSSSENWLSSLNSTVIKKEQHENLSIIDNEDSTLNGDIDSDCPIDNNINDEENSKEENEKKRPLLGCVFKQLRPILGAVNVSSSDTEWKRDALPALMLVDNRQLRFNFSRDELLTITPTFVGQLERFFGLVHHRGHCYMQHMWTDDEVPWRTRYMGNRTPYIFDVVLAKHSGDCKWYRAKVIDIDAKKHRVRVFYVDYGGVEYVDLSNLADLSRSISALPFQAVLFRFYDLFDATTTKAEREYGVYYLRTLLLKKTLTVRVTNYRYNEITICLEDPSFSHLPSTMIRKGLMKHYTFE